MTAEETVAAAKSIGYPVILRPSYVLGGRGMVVVSDEAALRTQVASGELFRISGDNPVLIDGFLNRATEIDVDAICDQDGDVFIAGAMEHIEEAGVHSGDSACSLPPRSLSPATIAEIERIHPDGQGTEGPGLMNVQYAIQGDDRQGSQPALAHRALCRQGHRSAGGRHRQPRHGRTLKSMNLKAESETHPRSRSGAALRPLPRRRYHPGPRCAPPVR